MRFSRSFRNTGRIEREQQEFPPPANLLEVPACQGGFEAGVCQVAHNQDSSGREDLHLRKALPQQVAGEDILHDFELRQFWHGGWLLGGQALDQFGSQILLKPFEIREEGRNRAEAEAEQIRQQAQANMDWAVDFVLSEVMP